LVGEKVRSFVSVEGRQAVCELCAGRTAELGWLPADEAGAEEKLRASSKRKPGFLAKLFARGEGPASHDLDTESYDVEAEWAAKRPAPPPPPAARPKPLPDPAAAPVRPRRLQPDLGAADLTPATRFERAIFRFNASDAGRTTAGLTRTLGAPSVSVGDLAGAGDEVRITVAWELTWYQWGVDLGDELRPVFELAKGFEVSEIDSAARQWNASAHDGRVVMVAPRAREAANGRPVHR
jgi:hypothetical protein